LQIPTAGTLNNRNLLFNGSMQVAQRSTAAESNAVAFNSNPAYDTVDRWGFWASSPDRFTSQQVVDAPPGHYNSLRITSTSAHTFTASHGFTVTQRIEAQNLYGTEIGTAAAKPYTFTFWVKSSLTGTFSFYALNGGFTKSFVSDYTINVADTWEYKTISIPAPTDAIFAGIGNARQMEVGFGLGAGSQFQTANLDAWVTESFKIDSTTSSRFLETNGATIQFTGVQLDVGDRATPFEYESYGQTLAKCQRYYQQSSNVNVGQFHTNIQGVYQTAFNYSGTTWVGASCALPVEMRSTPAVVLYTQISVGDPLPGRVGHYQLNSGWGASLAVVSGGTNERLISIASGTGGRGSTGPCLLLWNFTADAEL
jgi:hypothetical protein